MKIGIISDLHLGESEAIDFLEYQYKSMVFYLEELKKRDISTIVFLGDFLDDRKKITFITLQFIQQKIIPLLSDFNVYILRGNHDIYYKNSDDVCGLDLLFSDIPNFTIPDRTAELVINNKTYLFINWINSENYDDTVKTIKKSKADIAFGHLELANFEMIKGMLCKHDQIDRKLLSKFHKVYSGHFHIGATDKNICYVDTPIQHDFNDVNEEKGIIIIDDESYDEEKIINPYIKYRKIIVNDESDLDDIEQNQYIKLYINNNDKKIQKKIINLTDLPKLSIIDNTYQASEDIEMDVSNLDTVAIWNEYLALADDITDNDTEEMNQIFYEAYKEVGGEK
ncbi:metallophosphoesterase [uncultured Arcobacter sp.]|uniref:metallophosphoesterase n=1 Tax=uncultured Arcobacter sp. TaxID=165434 RepID=UPI0026353F12|nr:metallophosphoesterase [uncultured Arcobacter sp.]